MEILKINIINAPIVTVLKVSDLKLKATDSALICQSCNHQCLLARIAPLSSIKEIRDIDLVTNYNLIKDQFYRMILQHAPGIEGLSIDKFMVIDGSDQAYCCKPSLIIRAS
jgi:hypothetical protein